MSPTEEVPTHKAENREHGRKYLRASTEGADMDWISARCECSLPAMWDQLTERVAADLQQWNGGIGFGPIWAKVDEERSGHAAWAFYIRTNNPDALWSGVWVSVETPFVFIKCSGGTWKLEPVLNAKGEPRLLCEHQELELWQGSRLILEPLLFGTRAPYGQKASSTVVSAEPANSPD